MYCCSSTALVGCSVNVVGSQVIPDCKIHCVPPFKQAALKTSSKFPSTNQPIKCLICSERGPKPQDVFVPKYNMLEHHKQCHDLGFSEEIGAELGKHTISDEENTRVTDKFPIKNVEDKDAGAKSS